ncbi:hypothetical protein [Xanthocytophaga agilis]|nr:hypothetical protein [Xanthocytophaga agilis]
MLSNSADFTKTFEVYFSGVQIGLDGTSFTMLQYKDTLDSNNPPKLLIKVVFDSKGKIAGIQPLKRV